MSQDHLINMECTVCHNLNYQTKKNKKNTQKRLELGKYCKFCKKKQLHKETK
ncbi:MAG: 50S ribosomal protein L33 [Candidatus Doudnabacteria bacterium]|nr:50S ribosomal protein L33 [Candidatus Doudnabacteria bacterium]